MRVSPEARVDFALYGTVDPAEGATPHPRAGRGRRCRLQVLDLRHRPDPLSAHPAGAAAKSAFAAIAPTGLTAGVHNEDDEFVRAAMDKVKAAGITDYRAHALSRPPLTELLATLQIYETGVATGCPAHVVHCSLSRGYDIARRLPRRRVSPRPSSAASTIWCSTRRTTFAGSAARPRSTRRSARAPRSKSSGSRSKAGNVTLVSTDHVSWSENRKTDPDMLKNASGVPGLEVMLPLFVKGALERDVPLTMGGEADGRQSGEALPARSRKRARWKRARTPTSPCCCRGRRSTTRRHPATTSSAGRPTTASSCPGPWVPPICAAGRCSTAPTCWPAARAMGKFAAGRRCRR